MRLFPLPELEDKKEYPSFYAIIPAYVRYNKSLSPSAKLLFGEITALTNKHGYCYASNKYFANVFDVDKSSITHWVKQLIDTGCIMQELIYAKDKPIIEERRIYVTIPLLPSSNIPNQEDLPETKAVIDGLVQGSMHNDPQNMDNYAFPNEGGEIIHQGGENSHHGVVKNFNGGGEISPERILQANNTVVVDQSAQKTERPPPDETATTIPGEAINQLILNFAGLDCSLAFDAAFYPKVLAFLAEHDLSFDYVSWVYRYCSQENAKKHNAKNLSGYLFRVLLEPRYAALYLDSLSRSSTKPSDKVVTCPVCGSSFDASVRSCPVCFFDKDYFRDNERVELQKKLFSMPEESRASYEGELESLNNEMFSYGDYSNYKLKKNALDQKYGLS